MATISVEAWADGPDASGLWRGCWRLMRDGLSIRGRFGVTRERFSRPNEAVHAALDCGTRDKRNVFDAQ